MFLPEHAVRLQNGRANNGRASPEQFWLTLGSSTGMRSKPSPKRRMAGSVPGPKAAATADLSNVYGVAAFASSLLKLIGCWLTT